MKLLAMAVIAATLLTSAHSFASSTAQCGSGECVKCHAPKKDEFIRLFKKIDPDAKVLDVQMAQVKGLYQLTLQTPKSKGIVYMDFDKKHIVSGNIIDVSSKVNLTEAKSELITAKTVSVKKIPVKNALILGNPKGTRTLYVFTDPDCPYCLKLHPELKAMIQEDKNLQINLILSPLAMHPEAGWKSQAIIDKSRTNMTAAIAMLEENYSKKTLTKPQNKSLTLVSSNLKASKGLGVKLLPSIILPNGKMIEGYKTKEELKVLLTLG